MRDHRLERLIFFSDAVIAIAMTLLVIELRVPHLDRPDSVAFLAALWRMTPNFVGFAVSFLAIGAFWVNHHRGFALVAHYGPALAWRNLFLLMAIAFLPFASAMMSDYTGYLVPHLLYLGTLMAAGLLQRHLFAAALRPELVADDVPSDRVARLVRRMWGVPLAAGIGIVVALILPPVFSTIPLLLIPLFVRLLERSVRISGPAVPSD